MKLENGSQIMCMATKEIWKVEQVAKNGLLTIVKGAGILSSHRRIYDKKTLERFYSQPKDRWDEVVNYGARHIITQRIG